MDPKVVAIVVGAVVLTFAVAVVLYLVSRRRKLNETLMLWKTHDQMLKGILNEVNASLESNEHVILVCHFASIRDKIVTLLKDNSLDPKILKTESETSGLLDGLDGQGELLVVDSRRLSEGQTFSVKGQTLNTSVHVMVAGLYPIPCMDERVVEFALALPHRQRVSFCSSIDSPPSSVLGGDRNAQVMGMLGDEEVLSHPWLLKSMRAAQARVEQEFMTGDEVLAESPTSWTEKNLG